MLGRGQNGPSKTLRVSYWSNGLSELLLASYTFGGGQDGLYKVLQASYTLDGGQNGLSVLVQAYSTRLVVVKTDSPIFCKLSTRYRVLACFAWVGTCQLVMSSITTEQEVVNTFEVCESESLQMIVSPLSDPMLLLCG